MSETISRYQENHLPKTGLNQKTQHQGNENTHERNHGKIMSTVMTPKTMPVMHVEIGKPEIRLQGAA